LLPPPLFLSDALSGEGFLAVAALIHEDSARNCSPLEVTVALGISCLFPVIEDFSVYRDASLTVLLDMWFFSLLIKFVLIAMTGPTGLPSSSL